MMGNIPPHKSLEGFSEAIRREFIEGSAIAPSLYDAAIEIHSDLEFDETTGEPVTPIHDALNWKYTRFGYQVKPNQYGAFFQNEDGSTWQIKPANPLFDEKKGKYRKYERAKWSGTAPYCPPVDAETRKRIGQRHGVEVPAEGSFWDWYKAHPELPLHLDEGGKKGLCGLSNGFIKISLLGVHGGYRVTDEQGNPIDPEIIPELLPFLTNGRKVLLSFDQDKKSSTRNEVNTAISRFGKLIKDLGCQVKVATWKPSQGKGSDDLIVNCGVKAYEDAIRLAESLERWQWQNDYQERFKLSHQPAIQFNQKYITDGETRKPLFQIPQHEKLIGIKSPKGSGKTEALIEIVRDAIANGQWVLLLSHRVQLGQELCQKVGLPYVNEIRSEGRLVGFGLCIDSLHPKSQARFSADGWSNGIVLIDECEQVIWHTLNSDTCKKERVAILGQLRQLLTNVMDSPNGRVIVSDADLSDYSIKFIQGMASSEIKPWIVRNDYRPNQPWDIYSYDSREALLSQLTDSLKVGQKALILTTAQRAKSRYSAQTLERYVNEMFPDLRVLRIDSETVADKTHPAYGCTTSLNKVLSNYDVVIASPTIETGVSIDIKGHFNGVWAFMAGNLPENSARQFLARLREPVARHIFAEKYGKIGMIDRGHTSIKELLKAQTRRIKRTIRQLEDADLEAIETDFDRTTLLTWAEMATRINAGQYQYRDSLLWGLEDEGHIIHEATPGIGNLNTLKDTVTEVRDLNCSALREATATSSRIDEPTHLELKKKRGHTREELHQIQRYEIEQKYCTDSPDTDLIQKDEDGWFPKISLHYYLTVGNPYLKKRDRSKIDSLTHDNKIWMPDANRSTYSSQVGALQLLGIDASLIDPERDYRGTDADVEEIAVRAIENRRDVKAVLGVTINDKMSNVQILKALLGKFGLDLRCDGRDGRGGQRWYRLQNLDDGRLEVFDRWRSRDAQNSSQSATQPVPPAAENPMVAPAPLIRSITPPPGSSQTSEPTPQKTQKTNPKTAEERLAGRLVKWKASMSQWTVKTVEGAIATIEASMPGGYGLQQRQVPLSELEVVV